MVVGHDPSCVRYAAAFRNVSSLGRAMLRQEPGRVFFRFKFHQGTERQSVTDLVQRRFTHRGGDERR